jgi:hypothetical protein
MQILVDTNALLDPALGCEPYPLFLQIVELLDFFRRQRAIERFPMNCKFIAVLIP